MPDGGRTLVMRAPGGALGNQMFAFALAKQYAEEFGYELVLEADWLGSRIFEGLDRIPVFDAAEYRRFERDQSFRGVTFRENAIWEETGPGRAGRFVRCDDTLVTHRDSGLFRPPVVATHSRAWLRTVFTLREDIRRTPTVQRLAAEQGSYDAAHVRRGEILRPNYHGALSVISEASYRRAFARHGVDVERLRVCTNAPSDPATGRALPGHLVDPAWRINRPPASFAEELAFLEDLPCSPWRELHPGRYRFPQPYGQLSLAGFAALLFDFLTLLFARRLFRANSTLSWWIGCLTDGEVFAPEITDAHVDRRPELPRELRDRGNGRVIDVEFVAGNHPSYYTLPRLVAQPLRPAP